MTTMIPLLVAMMGVVVLRGWLIDNAFAKSIHPDFVSMKPMTAILFILSGLMIFIIKACRPKKYPQILVSFLACNILVSLVAMYANYLFDIHFGFPAIVDAVDNSPYTRDPLEPSLMTATLFFAIAIYGLLNIVRGVVSRCTRYFVAIILLVASTVALVGYEVGNPRLYYYHPDYSTAMALHTAVGFLLLGCAIFLRADWYGKR